MIFSRFLKLCFRKYMLKCENDMGKFSRRGGRSRYYSDYRNSSQGTEDDSGGFNPRGSHGGGHPPNLRRQEIGYMNIRQGREDERGGFKSRGGRGGGRPPHLRGREIGLWFAKRGKERKKREDAEMITRNRLEIDNYKEREISSLLSSMRPSDSAGPSTSRQELNSESSFSEQLSHIRDSDFKRQYLNNLEGNAEVSQGITLQDSWKSEKLERQSQLDETLARELNKTSQRYKEMLTFRKKLPAYKMREEILNYVRENQVIVVSGETGCGKTTQVAQFILDDAITSLRGSKCRVIVTQPRRISAISIAERVAQERDERLGESAGYQIRLDAKLPRQRGSILYCTTGILLQYLQGNPLLLGVSHVILDEIHERDVLSDFIITIIKDILPQRPDLKLVLMSATLNAELFSQYFNNCPKLEIPGFTFPVTEFYLEDALQVTGFTDFKPPRAQSYARWGRAENREKREEFSSFIHPYVQYLRDKGSYSESVLTCLQNPNSEEINYELVASLTEYICKSEGDGAILIFLPGWTDISKLHKILSEGRYVDKYRTRILPLHSMLPTVNQKEIFDRPPPGIRKIVIATNIAETSITIDDVVYVIDCGKIKMTNYDSESNLQTLKPEWVSLANAKQRRGRAGRVKPGICYHLYSRGREKQLQENPLPEILRTRLEEQCLQIKLLKLGMIRPFLERCIESPSKVVIDNSLSLLYSLDAMDKNENLTPLGFHLAHLPMDPQTAKMLVMACIFSCIDPVLTIASSLSYKDPYVIPLGKEKEADFARFRLSSDVTSDHMLLVAAFNGWKKASQGGYEWKFCNNNFLSLSTLRLIDNMRKQHAKLLYQRRFLRSDDPEHYNANINSSNASLVKAIVASGLYPNIGLARVHKKKKRFNSSLLKLSTPTDRKVEMHPKSVCTHIKDISSPWFVYKEKVKSSAVYIHDASIVSAYPLIFFGKNIRFDKNVAGDHSGEDGIMSVDDYVKVSCSSKTAQLIMDLRLQLNNILKYRVSHPEVTNWSSKDGSVLRAIVDIITTEGSSYPDVSYRSSDYSY